MQGCEPHSVCTHCVVLPFQVEQEREQVQEGEESVCEIVQQEEVQEEKDPVQEDEVVAPPAAEHSEAQVEAQDESFVMVQQEEHASDARLVGEEDEALEGAQQVTEEACGAPEQHVQEDHCEGEVATASSTEGLLNLGLLEAEVPARAAEEAAPVEAEVPERAVEQGEPQPDVLVVKVDEEVLEQAEQAAPAAAVPAVLVGEAGGRSSARHSRQSSKRASRKSSRSIVVVPGESPSADSLLKLSDSIAGSFMASSHLDAAGLVDASLGTQDVSANEVQMILDLTDEGSDSEQDVEVNGDEKQDEIEESKAAKERATLGELEASSNVARVERVGHVRWDPKTKSYIGLPPEWAQALEAQFGLPPLLSASDHVEGYKSRIPVVLGLMKEYLIENGGLEVRGIFRLAPDAAECQRVKDELNRKVFKKCDDVNCISNLIKVWFRSLPRKLLAHINAEQVESCTKPAQTPKLIECLAEPDQSIFLWLLDLLVLVMSKAEVNMMSAQNLAIVVAPNLIATLEITAMTDPQDALKTMTLAKAYTKFVEHAILHRAKTHPTGPVQRKKGFKEMMGFGSS